MVKTLKSQLYAKCLEYVDQRISNVQLAINFAAESSENETKSSAGDKHETGRAMAQLEQEKSVQQLEEATELKKLLLKINPGKESTLIAPGSLILTDNGNFYIAISAGKIIIDNEIYFSISPISPVAKILMGKIEKQEVKFNGRHYSIEKIL